MKTSFIILCAVAISSVSHAGSRSSLSYAVTTETTDAAGRRNSSAIYTNDASLGGIGGQSIAVTGVSMKHSYIGQLYDEISLTLTAAAATVNETATIQLGARLNLDDGTLLTINAASVAWGASGALSMSAGGLGTAGAVYQDTPMSIFGSHRGLAGIFNLTVINTLPDNFGSYAGDGLADDWQVQYFGVGNAAAGASFDPDSDGHSNLFEYQAQLDPTDPLSRFGIRLSFPVSGSADIAFSPRFTGSTYTLMGSEDLTGWAPIIGNVKDVGTLRIITDANGKGDRKFYRVEITRP